jgi:endo-1,4-beta-xylanase
MKITRYIVGLTVLALFTSCGSGQSLRQYAEKKGIDTGYAVGAGDLYQKKNTDIIIADSSIVVGENCMKWNQLRPNDKFWNWSDADHFVEFAEKNKMKVKFHTLVWHNQNPSFLNNMKTRDEALAVLDNYITTVMTRYKGRIYCYDVVNEMFNEDGSLRQSVWYTTIGPDYIEHALLTAHAADPDAKLYLNDYNNEAEGYAKADALYNLVKDFRQRGIPVDGVGMQMHLAADQPFNEAAVRNNIERYQALGVDVSFSEVDVRIPSGNVKEYKKTQQDVYCRLMKIALDEKAVKSIIFWGFTDLQSWVPQGFPGYGDACLYDKKMKPKPVYSALLDILKK